MKRISFLNYLLAMVILTLIAIPQSSIQSQSFNSIYSTNGTILWLAGNNGLIYRSGDGGQSFSDKSQGTANSDSNQSSRQIFICGSAGTLLKSTNQGVNFTQSIINAGENLTSVFFFDASTGWISTGTGKIYYSTNGGNNWSQQNSPTANYLNKIKFSTALTGIACGINGTFIKTTNGGVNWSSVTIPTSKEIFSLDIKGNMIFAVSKDGIILKSTDVGVTWSIIKYKAVIAPDVTGIAIPNDSTVYICGEGGFIQKSTNKGVTFDNQNNPSWCELRSVYFYNSLNGWSIGSNNMVLRTINGGQNWYMPNGTNIDLSWS